MPPATCHLATTPAAADRVFSRNYNRKMKYVETLIMLTPRRAAAVNQQIFEFFVRKEA